MMAAQLQQASGAASTAAGGDGPPHGGAAPAQAAPGPPPVETEPLRNRAGESKSPFVRKHAETAVSWQLLDDEAVERAKKENKPIYLHIGFLACHCAWSLSIPLEEQSAELTFLEQTVV